MATQIILMSAVYIADLYLLTASYMLNFLAIYGGAYSTLFYTQTSKFIPPT